MSVVTSNGGDVVIEFVRADGTPVRTSLGDATATVVVQGMPVRRFGSYAGMRHYPGWWWSSTNKDLVGYESLLERDRLLLADFDLAVEGIASQPFGITGLVSGKERRHVPDYLLVGTGDPTVVDVKPARLLARPEVRRSWNGRRQSWLNTDGATRCGAGKLRDSSKICGSSRRGAFPRSTRKRSACSAGQDEWACPWRRHWPGLRTKAPCRPDSCALRCCVCCGCRSG